MITPKNLVAKARNLLKNADASSIPVDVERVATEHMGLKIVRRPLEREYSGFLAVREKTIVVNRLHPLTRQRFTIAHEIGHYELHRGKVDMPVFIERAVYFRSDRDKMSGAEYSQERRLEKEADDYAAALLMPEECVADYLNAHPLDLSDYSREVKEIAGEFEVSKQAMDYRLRYFGFVPAGV